jgi:seryl-tRNA synthetase
MGEGMSEVPLAGYHAGEILNLDKPRRYAGWSSFPSRGRITARIAQDPRVHQFDKVRCSHCRPEEALPSTCGCSPGRRRCRQQ